MSWIQRLSETYDNCLSMRGYSGDDRRRPLLPICHTTGQAHITLVIDGEGNVRQGYLVTDPRDATTIIPCTEASGSRSGKKPEGHPLCDQLQYIAGDFVTHGGSVTSGFEDDPQEPFRNYISTLTKWCESEFAHPKVKAVLKYVKRKSLVKDLSKQQLLLVRNGRLITKSERKKDKKTTDVFDVVSSNSQDKVFVRWEVQIPGDPASKLWKDPTVWDSWIEYYINTKKKEPLCFALGKDAVLSDQHPRYIRAKGDGAKLISSNDLTGFTFRGRFTSADQACGLSLDISQKAHSALQWLIDRQGKVFWIKGDGGRRVPALSVVAWAISGRSLPKITDDTLAIALGYDELPDSEPITVSTAQEVALKFQQKMLGYATELKMGTADQVIVMAMDSASKGRLAITYYRENLSTSDFLSRIETWHRTCEWIHEYRYKAIEDLATGQSKKVFQPFIGAPAPIHIAEAAYGRKVDDKLKNTTVARILPCILDGYPIPKDILESTVKQASNRIGLKDPKDRFEREWNKALTIACALFRKNNIREEYSMALDPNRKKRDYLYGRLLAIADHLEGHALRKAEEKRDTNAARYMQRFADRPNTTWRQIYLSLSPYMSRLGGASWYKDRLDEVMCMFDPTEFNSDDQLTGEFLLGYHCQRAALWEAKKKKEDQESTRQEEN